MAVDEMETARTLASYMTERNGYSSKSPLEEAVRAEIRKMLAGIAENVVRDHPQVRDFLEAKAQEVIREALRDEAWLEREVVEACSRALAARRLGVALDDENSEP